MIKHDGLLALSIGKHRKDTSWKVKELNWSEIVVKLSKTHVTAETVSEYNSAKKSRQDEIKDIGGFVGGVIHGGRRKARSVMSRQIITLDLDFAHPGFWEDFTMLYGDAAVVYSTHKHTPEKPRLRLIMPLDREVNPTEYEAIARRVAGNLDIELFDPTTFQPERLMYWPSTSKDGEYEYHFQDGDWLSADDVLSTYRDWTDCSQWPVSSKVSELLKKSAAHQGDPLEKPGTIGAFCRTYDIHEALEVFLGKIYTPCDNGRYTYLEGSTAGGLVIYDDKFAYSHHGTDPISGKLCNAFDLVRTHLFGAKDEEAKDGTPVSKLPSYLAMQDFISRDAKVKRLLVDERNAMAREDFKMGELEEDETGSDDWKERLDVDRHGNVYGTIDNISLVLENDPYFRGRIAYDDFEKCEVAVKDLPWRKVGWHNRRLVDMDDANIRHYLEKAYGISHLAKTRDAMLVWAQRNSFHPVRDYLNGLSWDGEHRLEQLLTEYLGASQTDYVRTVTRKTLVAAVARVMEPGVKFDNMLVLVGDQGLKKSSLFMRMGGRWFSDSFSFNLLHRNETKAYEQIQGSWIIECPELSGMAKSEIEAVKHFISKREDKYRVAYGHKVENFPRQCIIVGTTNRWDFLKDPTGNRRYWPVVVHETLPEKDVLKDLSAEEIDQIWAEAVHYYQTGEALWLSEAMLLEAVEVQRRHTEEHPWTELIRNYLDIKVPVSFYEWQQYDRFIWLQNNPSGEVEGAYRMRVCVYEIWYECLGRRDAIDEKSAGIIRNALRMIGWKESQEQKRFGVAYGRQRRGFFREEIPGKFEFLNN
jgi:putative DNA primase/helicase